MAHIVVSSSMKGYPDGLNDLEDPPRLFIDGALPLSPAIAVVGTRRCTRYGIDLAEAFGNAIAESGWSTVSGLARGIDAAAHRGCLAGRGHATGVLGCGIDVRYPKENAGLFEQIRANGGAIISEYPPGTPPDRWRFPARNRIIAAISDAVVVVEAAIKGGALITARLAAEIGRPVFVVPGDVDRAASAGCNLLLRDGAHPVLGANDLLAELSLVVGPPVARQKTNLNSFPADGLDIEQLSELWGASIQETLAQVGRLEIEGSIAREGGRFFRR